jgi:D-xylose transport system substrate-binding protein
MCIFYQWRATRFILLCFLVLSALILASCDTSNMTSGSGTGPIATNGGKGCTKVGILLPDSTTSPRWETKDHPLLVQNIEAAIPNVHIDYANAQDNSATQLSQAETDLANGDCILVVAPNDSVAASAIVTQAKLQNVPVIAYDRLIQSKDLSYYVSFDNVKVGQLQAQYIEDHYLSYESTSTTNTNTPGTPVGTVTSGTPTTPEVNMMMISGSQTDDNALLFSQGAHIVLDPLFAKNKLKNVYETFTPNWDNNTAQAETEAALADQDNNIQIAYVANDGMAGGVIAALKAVGLDGKVLVTGQDATAAGVHDILTGEQSMTVYKPIAQEAQSTGELVKDIYLGISTTALTNGETTTTYNGGTIPAILDIPIAVDKTNIETTVIADKYLAKSDICQGIPVGTDGVC